MHTPRRSGNLLAALLVGAAAGKDRRPVRLTKEFFTSMAPWPYGWRGQPLPSGERITLLR